MQKVLNAIRKVRFSRRYVKRVSRKRKDHRWEKQVVPRQRSPSAPKFENRSHEETGRQPRCAQSKAWDLATIFYKLEENDRAYILLTYKEVGSPKCFIKRDV